jgi:protein-tyrosine phosphatase
MTITDRLRPVAGTYNLRDTGGYPAETGTTRHGRLFRSDALHRLTDDSREKFAELGITLVVDLRDESELAHSPSRLEGLGAQVVHTPIYSGAAPAASAASLAEVTLDDLYRTMVAEHGDNLAAAVRHIARSGDGVVLVHCTAGKDRTGLVVALALSAAGVDRDAVIADYAETEANLSGEWVTAMLERMQQSGYADVAGLEQIVSASPPELMAAILDLIDEEHGSVSRYLVANGLEQGDLDLLREALIEPSTTPSIPTTERASIA